MAGLDSRSTTTAEKDPYAALHAKLFHETLGLAQTQQTDFTPGPPAVVPTDLRPQVAGKDTTTPPPVKVADGLPAPDQPDLQGTPKPGADNRQPATTAGDQPGPAATGDKTCAPFNYGDAGSSDQDQKICNWRPNPNSQSQLTKDWFAAHSQQASVPIDSDSYTVKFGDCLESIAKRELTAENKATDRASIKAEVARIVALNHDHYKSLDCNNEFIKDGWKLKLRDCPPADAPPPPKPVPPPDDTCNADKPCPGDGPAHVEPTNKPVERPKADNCAPCSGDVVITNPHGKTFLNNRQVGDHDVTIITGNRARELPLPQEKQQTSEAPLPPKPGDPPVKTADAKTDLPSTPAPADLPPPDAPPPVKVVTAPPKKVDTPVTTDDLTPGDPPVQAAEVVPPAPKPKVVAKPAPVKAPADANDIPGDGNDLGPG